jgi:hypothetical protein
MAHTFGSISLPMAEPDPSVSGSMDPSLDVLAVAVPALLTKWLQPAFGAVEPSFDLIGTVFRFDPKAVYDGSKVTVQDAPILPALYIFSRRVSANQIADALEEVESEISILWLPDSRQNLDLSVDDSLFRTFARAIAMMVKLERDPGWVSDTDAITSLDATEEAKRQAARRLGSNIPDACGFSSWRMPGKDAVIRDHFTLTAAALDPLRYDGFLAKITAVEFSEVIFDGLAAGYAPTSLEQSLNSGGSDPLTTGGFLRPPAP